MKRLDNYYFFVFFITIFISTQAQNKIGFSFDDTNLTISKLKFKFESNQIIIPVQFNGKDSLRFIVDTGLKNTVVFENKDTDSLIKNLHRDVIIYGWGDVDSIVGKTSHYNQIKIGNLEDNAAQVLVVNDSTLFKNDRLNTKIHGIIGYELFKNYAVKIDYQTKKLKFYSEKNKRKYTREYAAHDLEIVKGRPFLNFELIHGNGTTEYLRGLLDTGSSLPIMLVPPYKENYTTKINRHIGIGVLGDINGEISRVKGVRFSSGFDMEQVLITLPYVDEFSEKASMLRKHQANIGNEIFRRFDLVFDYKNSKLYYKKNSNFKDDYLYNLAGIEVRKSRSFEKFYEIFHISKDSQLLDLGVEQGDLLVYINRKLAYEYSLEKINDIFSQSKKLKLGILRSGGVVYVEVKLEEKI